MVGGDHGHPGLIYRTLVGAAAAALPPERHSTVIGINPAGLAQPPPCAAFCDNSSPTRAACSGGAQQPCPPIPVFITRGVQAQSEHFPPPQPCRLWQPRSPRAASAKPDAKGRVKSQKGWMGNENPMEHPAVCSAAQLLPLHPSPCADPTGTLPPHLGQVLLLQQDQSHSQNKLPLHPLERR